MMIKMLLIAEMFTVWSCD